MSEPRTPTASSAGSSRYLIYGVLLLAAVVLMAATLFVVARHASGIAADIGLVSEQRLLARGFTALALEAVQGHEDSYRRLAVARDRFDQSLAALQQGGDEAPAVPAEAGGSLSALAQRWQTLRGPIGNVLQTQTAIMAVRQQQAGLDELMPQLQKFADDLANAAVDGGVAPRLMQMSTRLTALLPRIQYGLAVLMRGEAGSALAADHLSRDLAQFTRTVRSLQAADMRAGMSPAMLSALGELAGLSSKLEVTVGGVLAQAPDLFQAQDAAQTVLGRSAELANAANELLAVLQGLEGNARVAGVPLNYPVAAVFGSLAFVLLVVILRKQTVEGHDRLLDAEARKLLTEEQNRRNQEAILRLLDEMGDLAEGDLTVQASVTEDITGAIADSINYAIEALRDLVATINDTSARVAAASEETRAIADRLATASQEQAAQVESAGSTIAQMARSLDDVSGKTAASAEVAQQSAQRAREGGERVRRTIQGMDAIREHIQETAKRIKRLGESSQEIGDIIELINDIADQTNILALNAAIQASAAGEAGRGFAVVADEVQRLAERSGHATKRIESLVKTIQADTNEAVISMEKSTTEVVNGAGLAETAGESLTEIESVSARLAELIDDISHATAEVSTMATRVAGMMGSINAITAETAEGSSDTARAIGDLSSLARDLRQSVAGFRLPGQESA